MKIFFAGNFPQMSKPELERAMRDKVLESNPEYCRLISFFFEKSIQTVLDMKEEENEIQSEMD